MKCPSPKILKKRRRRREIGTRKLGFEFDGLMEYQEINETFTVVDDPEYFNFEENPKKYRGDALILEVSKKI